MYNPQHTIDQLLAQLPADLLAQVEVAATRRAYAKHEFLLRAGQVCRHIYVVEQGLVRNVVLVDGTEITTSFTFAQGFTASLQSQTRQQPSAESIQALAPTLVYQIDYEHLTRLRKQYPILADLDTLLLETYAMALEERLFAFQTQTAKQRYNQLLEREPHLLQSVPLTHIASYLGINLGSLSRIRAER
jgi:CRP-like cAMP-binding protein